MPNQQYRFFFMRFFDGKPAGIKVWLFLVPVFAILLAIVIPTVQGVIKMGGPDAQSALQVIVRAYSNYRANHRSPAKDDLKIGDTAHALAVLLAQQEGINNAGLWVIKTDGKLAGVSIPAKVLSIGAKSGSIDSDFAKLTLAYEFAANIPADASPISTPVAWTRGLQPDGTWAKGSPWQGDGGHIAFLDGHVEWHEKLGLEPVDDPLVKYGTTTPTLNIREALPPGAIILSAEPNPAPAKTP